MRKTGLSAASAGKRGEKFEINEELFITFKENNITAMEVCMPFGVDLFNLDFPKLNDFADKHGVDLWSFHLPFSDFYDASSNDAKDGISSFKMLIKRASKSNIKCVVIHPSTEIVTNEGREQRKENSKNNLSELCDYANSLGVDLAVENLPRLCIGNSTSEMVELMDANPNLKICFDTNHIALGEHTDFMRTLKDRIVTVHIADYNIPDNHLRPFDGQMDWKEFIRVLNEIKYNGPFIYETGRLKKDGTYCDMDIYRQLHEKIENLA